MDPMFLALFPLLLSACVMQTTVPVDVRRELAPTGELRAGINYGNPVLVQRDPAGGDPLGVAPDLARELARRLGVPIRYVTFDAAGKLADAAKGGALDVVFLAIDPERAADITFTAPYVQIEGTYLVRKDSRFKTLDDVDREGVRILVGAKSAYDLFLTPHIKRAQLVRGAGGTGYLEEYRKGTYEVDVVAGVRQALIEEAKRNPQLRVMEGHFMVIPQASGVPKGRDAAARYLNAFIGEMKASGFVKRSLEKSGNGDVTVP